MDAKLILFQNEINDKYHFILSQQFFTNDVFCIFVGIESLMSLIRKP